MPPPCCHRRRERQRPLVHLERIAQGRGPRHPSADRYRKRYGLVMGLRACLEAPIRLAGPHTGVSKQALRSANVSQGGAKPGCPPPGNRLTPPQCEVISIRGRPNAGAGNVMDSAMAPPDPVRPGATSRLARPFSRLATRYKAPRPIRNCRSNLQCNFRSPVLTNSSYFSYFEFGWFFSGYGKGVTRARWDLQQQVRLNNA
jgi:hypothetical protein